MSLSEKELAFLQDPAPLLMKRQVGAEVERLLRQCHQALRPVVAAAQLPQQVTAPTAKLSKGENYLGLPYWVMDYPRCFGQESIFALRTLVWWGHEASLTLHLSGEYVDSLEVSRLLDMPFYVCINADPWQHHFGADNYRLLSEVGMAGVQNHLERHGFLKVAVKTELSALPQLPEFVADWAPRLLACWA